MIIPKANKPSSVLRGGDNKQTSSFPDLSNIYATRVC